MEYLNEKIWNTTVSNIKISNENKVDTAFTGETQNLLVELEDSSWWFIYRANIIIHLMRKFFNKDCLTLDIGSGNGYTASIAQKSGFNMGIIEPSLDACHNAQNRGIKEINCGAVTNSSIRDESLNQLLLLDVLEHIENDYDFINLLYKKMSKHGLLLITVPAFMCLWSDNDEISGHFRRYRLKDLCNILKKQNFKILYKNHFMSFIFFPILFVRVFLKKIGLVRKQTDRSKEENERKTRLLYCINGKLFNCVLSLLESLEKFLIKKGNTVPFGSSLIIVAKKVY